LCKKVASLWAGKGILGIAPTPHAHADTATWANTIHALCKKGKRVLST